MSDTREASAAGGEAAAVPAAPSGPIQHSEVESDSIRCKAGAMAGDLGRPPIVFFDGVCGLCNRFVRLLVRCDRHRRLHYAPLQGETARALLPALPDDPAHWSVVYVDETGTHTRSDAALRICARAGGWLRPLAWLRIVPRPLRDWAYGFIAKRRYRWFGRHDACPLPTAAQRQQMLP